MGPRTRKKMKVIGLTSHSSAMNLVIQFTSNGVVPGQGFSEIPQLFFGASSEQGAQAILTYREPVQGLQHFKYHRDGHGIQHDRRQRTYHLESTTVIKAE